MSHHPSFCCLYNPYFPLKCNADPEVPGAMALRFLMSDEFKVAVQNRLSNIHLPRPLLSSLTTWERISSFSLTKCCLPPVIEAVSGKYTCAICIGLPRHPVILKNVRPQCPHTFCRCCIQQIVENAARQHSPSNIDEPKGTCPMCLLGSPKFTRDNFLEYDNWHPHLKDLWMQIKVSCCWDGCTFEGHPFATRTHEYSCQHSQYSCPADKCKEKGSIHALKIHFPTCKFLHIHCPVCGLTFRPNMETDQPHDCLTSLRTIVGGMNLTTYDAFKRYQCI